MANNLQIVSNNVANIATTLVASSTAGSLAASNLLTDIKSQVWRSTGCTSESLTVNWTVAQLVGCVSLPYCNFTSSATIRVQAYSDAGITLLYDSGVVPACAYAPFGSWNWGAVPLGVNGFSQGGYAYATLWFPIIAVKQLTITFTDATNPLGYLEAGRLVCGTYWTPTFNADYGVSLTMNDTSTHLRSDAGDKMTTIGTRSRKISLSLTNMLPIDRAALINLLLTNGMPQPIFFSMYPSNSDPVLEQNYEIYCKVDSMNAMTTSFVNAYSSTLDLDEI